MDDIMQPVLLQCFVPTTTGDKVVDEYGDEQLLLKQKESTHHEQHPETITQRSSDKLQQHP